MARLTRLPRSSKLSSSNRRERCVLHVSCTRGCFILGTQRSVLQIYTPSLLYKNVLLTFFAKAQKSLTQRPQGTGLAPSSCGLCGLSGTVLRALGAPESPQPLTRIQSRLNCVAACLDRGSLVTLGVLVNQIICAGIGCISILPTFSCRFETIRSGGQQPRSVDPSDSTSTWTVPETRDSRYFGKLGKYVP